MSGLSQIFLFLLDPERKVFECVKLEVLREIGTEATIGDILDVIPARATEPALVAQRHYGLCRRRIDDDDDDNTKVLVDTSALASTNIDNGEVLIAIPVGFTAEKCRRLVEKILAKNPKISKILQRPDPLAPRSKNKNRKRSKGVGGNIVSTSLSLEAIAEDDGDSKSERDMEGSVNNISIDGSVAGGSIGGDEASLDNNPDAIKRLLSEKKQEEDNARKAIEALIRHESARKLLEEKVQQNADAREMARVDIEKRIQNDAKDEVAAVEVDLDLASENEEKSLTAEEQIERMALEATELEMSLMSDQSFSSPPASPPASPERSNLYLSDTYSKNTDTENSASLQNTEPQLENINISDEQAGNDTIPKISFRDRCKWTKRRLRRARIATKERIRYFLEEKPSRARVLSSSIVAVASALYHIHNPSSAEMLVTYIVLFIIASVLAILVRRRKRLRRKKAMRRRSRSLSMTPRRRSIRGISLKGGEPITPTRV